MQTQGSKEEKYLTERWQSQRDYYSQQSKKNKQWHQSLLVTSSIGAIIVPVLFNMPEIPKWVPTILSILVSVALALDNIYHFGDNWRTFRQTLEGLKQERVFFDAGIEPYSDPQTALPLFVQRCEAFMGKEQKRYFERYKLKEKNTSENSPST